LFVIGAGSGGVRASRMAAGFGARVAVAEASRLGGTCVNLGCVPKKLMVYASMYSAAIEDAAGFGWSVPEPSFDWPTLIANKDREITRLNNVYQGLLENAGVRIINGRARLRDRHTIEVDGTVHTADKVLIATGSRPFVPPIPGAGLGITSDQVFHLERQPRKVLVTGGGYIAVEFASIFNGLGSEVVLNYRGPLFLRGFDDDVRTTLAGELRKRGIELRFDTIVARLETAGDGVAATFGNGDVVEADLMLCAIGRVPNTSGLGLEELGVELDARGAVVVDQYFESSVPGIHALGDVIDRIALTPVALAEGMALAQTLFNGNPTTVDYSGVPTAVFSQPSVGAVGLSEDAARTAGYDVVIFRSSFKPMLHNLSGRDERTMMKLVVDRATDRVLGVHMVGPDAGEIIQGMAVALKAGATKKTFDATVGIHPTAAEEFVTMRTPVA
ncbi:MAG TPA: glutathione-disulfide reductase, partial [Candidatus Sulfomarinibacteraceae bacterium]|nr:glutathione-disulfide reductase [Candidatus Sulfomarinibacteraceae bacterium]